MFRAHYGQIRAMLNGAGLQEEVRSGIWAERASIGNFYPKILATRVTKGPHKSYFLKKKRIALIIKNVWRYENCDNEEEDPGKAQG
jgi:hypothetical protein